MSQLSLIRHGGLLADIDAAIRECVREVCEKGKSGSVTIKLSIKPATKTSNSNVIISDEVSLKTPKLPTAESILFTTRDGDLCESDPRQGQLNFSKVEIKESVPEVIEPERFQKVN